MTPKTFFKKLSSKIENLDSEKKEELFNKSNLEILKRISEYCQKNKKVIVITDRQQCADFYKILRFFKLSIYYTRRGWAIFLTNFSGKKFTKIRDDRYRFLKKLYPKCKEYKELLKKRNDFFEHVLK